jgi:hypothetical protein
MSKKPKAFRAIMCRQDPPPGHSAAFCPLEDGEGTDCLIIPDGAPIPQPASVRRVMRAVKVWRESASCTQLTMELRLCDAYDKHQAAEARREGK